MNEYAEIEGQIDILLDENPKHKFDTFKYLTEEKVSLQLQ